MIRKAYIIGTVALGLALTATTPAFVSSARHFQQCFRGIQDTSSNLSPLERVVFGLVLANTAPHQQAGSSFSHTSKPLPRT